MAGAPAIPAALLVAGGYLAWFGVHYWRADTKYPTEPLKAVLQGKPLPKPTRSGETADIGSLTSAFASQDFSGGDVTTTGESQIASAAIKYIGFGYVFGGPSTPGKWDCSSFANYVVGHDCGLKIPGGTWASETDSGREHGPATPSWMLFGTGIELSQVKAGDLIVSAEHMGIAISPTRMVSAQDEALGVGESNFPAGFPGGPPVYRRVSGG